jgi:hypothetical protein
MRLPEEFDAQVKFYCPNYTAALAVHTTLNVMRTGFRSGYWVVEWSDEFDPNLTDVVARFPEILQGHRVAIASCDSGPYEPTQVEYERGWIKKGQVAVSLVVDVVSALPMPGFDEWYVYPGEVPDGHHRSFVNCWGFAPLDDRNSAAQDFWSQVERFRPLHVVGAGTPTIFFATQDEAIFRMVSNG